MATKYWIKLYHEILDDPKMGRMSEILFARCIKIFLLAGECDKNGELPSMDDIAWRLRITLEELESDLFELQKIGILIRTPEAKWIVRKFADRQAPMDKAEYMRRKRSEQQSLEYYGNELPDSYEDVTDSNADTDTDIDTEEKKNNTAAAPPAAPPTPKTSTPFMGMDAQRVFCEVTGMVTFPSSSRDADIDRITALFGAHNGGLADYLRPFYAAWTGPPRHYNKANTGWLDWAIAGEIPLTKAQQEERRFNAELEKLNADHD